MVQQAPTSSIWSNARRPRPVQAPKLADHAANQPDAGTGMGADSPKSDDPRSDFQHDYDRLLFSTPVRRLADKTQVWPMDENDSVRTRLTHSHEVANLARSIGTRVYLKNTAAFDTSRIGSDALLNVIQPILLATGLGHDLGNPPFGHQGEAAIGRWFKHRQAWIFSKRVCGVLDLSVSDIVPDALRAEFTAFDGNPQALRLLTRLQTHVDGMGLDLSAATLAAGLKYPVSFAGADEKSPVKKKGGYFSSERSVVDWIRNQTGLDEGQRHPLTWIMEACDDIAYSVLDVDDVLKKAVMSPDDVLVVLRRKIPGNPTVNGLHDLFIRIEDKEIRPDALRDIKIQYLRAHFIGALISHASDQFTDNITAIFSHRHEMPLMDNSPLCTALKEIAKKYAFENPDVLRAEALGAAALDGLMSAFWEAISDRKKHEDIESKRLSARSKYIFSLISPNYVQEAASATSAGYGADGLRYRELRLLTDMVSGMTDSFAMRLWGEIQKIPNVNSAK
jgi:dGTPase